MANVLFGGINPQLIEQQIAAERQKNLLEEAKLDPAAYLRYSAGLQGQRIGQETARLFNVEQQDPRLKQASDAKAAYDEALELSGGDANSAAFLKAFANTAAKRGIPALAQQAADAALKMESEAALGFQRTAAGAASLATANKERSPYSLIDPSKVTKASLAKYETSRNITDLEFLPDVNKGTEFERLIKDLPPEEQTRLKADYLRSITTKVMPPATAALIQKDIDTLGSLKFTTSEVKSVLSDLKTGTLKLGLKNNFVNSFKTLSSSSTEGSRAYTRFNAVLEGLRNQSLRLNTGVQTEGDAVRALNEFMANYSRYDTKTAVEQLDRVVQKFEAAEQSKRDVIKRTANRYGEDISDLLPTTIYSPSSGKTPKYSDDVIMREFNDPKNRAWQSRGFEAFKKKFSEQNQ